MNSHEEFHQAVDFERETLTRLANYWNSKIQGEVSVSSETEGRIRAAVGKTHLLLSEKFKQFEGLLEKSENKTSEKEISFYDLQGFWELVLLQVNEIKEVFQSFGPIIDQRKPGNTDSSEDEDQKAEEAKIKNKKKEAAALKTNQKK